MSIGCVTKGLFTLLSLFTNLTILHPMKNGLTNRSSKFIKLIIVLILLQFSFNSNAQLITSQASSAAQVTQFVQNIFIGQGVTVSNVTYTGDLQSIGSFNTGANATALGIDSGICLSTGNVLDLPGAGSSFASTSTSGGSDPQLDSLITQTINDAAVLEFDFTPLSDTIKFDFVFGSEEYPEYVGSFNDVFGFFITGINPGNLSNPYVNYNVALLPGTTTPVSIYNVNNGFNNTGPCVNCQYYVNNSSGTYIVLDGFTTVLTAETHVSPCTSYHIKIVIGDAGDQVYDSGVFLKAGSFETNDPFITQSLANVGDTIAMENCNDVTLNFVLNDTAISPVSIPFQMSGTAINGVDFTQIQSPIIIPAGQIMSTLTISPIADTIVETTEYIDLVFSTIGCTLDSTRIYIQDKSELSLTLPNDTQICVGDAVNIWTNVVGGLAPYDYLWSTGDTLDSLIVNPIVDSVYSLTVTDGCGNDTTQQIQVGVSLSLVDLGVDTTIKWSNGFVILDAGNPNATWLWSTGATTQTVTFDKNNLPLDTNTVSVLVTDNYCSTSDTIIITVIDDVSLEGTDANLGFDIYPNPNEGVFDMSIRGYEGEVMMRIIDTNGKLIYQEELNVSDNYLRRFNMANLAVGSYFIILKSDKGMKIQKMIIQ